MFTYQMAIFQGSGGVSKWIAPARNDTGHWFHLRFIAEGWWFFENQKAKPLGGLVVLRRIFMSTFAQCWKWMWTGNVDMYDKTYTSTYQDAWSPASIAKLSGGTRAASARFSLFSSLLDVLVSSISESLFLLWPPVVRAVSAALAENGSKAYGSKARTVVA